LELTRSRNIENSVNRTEISRYTFSMIIRRRELETLRMLLKRNPVVGIVGAREAGKPATKTAGKSDGGKKAEGAGGN